MTGRRRTDAEKWSPCRDQPEYDYGGLGTMIAREMAVEPGGRGRVASSSA